MNKLSLYLRSNAGFSLLTGILSIVLSSQIAAWMGVSTPIAFVILGIGLLGFAAMVYLESRPTKLRKSSVTSIIIADIGWVVGSVLLLIFDWLELTAIGNEVVLIVALVVAFFAVQQYRHLALAK